MEGTSHGWLEQELSGCRLPDARLRGRLRALLQKMSGAVGDPIPRACEDWAATKAAHRFFSNDRFSEHEILAGHFEATRGRFSAASGTILVLHDTTEFSYRREKPEAIGATVRTNSGKDAAGRLRLHTVCGLLLHDSLAVTTDGLPLGLTAAKFWTRKKFKGTNALKRKINPTRVPIEEKESMRWLEGVRRSTELLGEAGRVVHIGDRESDIYELFCLADELGTNFLVRACVDRLAENRHRKVSQTLEETPLLATHDVTFVNAKGKTETATLEMKYRRIRILPPIGKQRRYPALDLTVLHAREAGAPEGRKAIDWKLVTNLPIASRKDATEKLDWYAMRWKIETFHKILKSGCNAEKAKLRAAERLTKLIAVFCIIAWRVFWMTMLKREKAPPAPETALTETEMRLLDQLIEDKDSPPKKTLADYIVKIARLGGYLDRKNDPPPGNMVIWRGMSRLTDIHLGVLLGMRFVGN
ncbi:MAG: IS4 family transposase [Pseudomonadota bacterium]